jgi:ketosteroid isomerase-like protein
VTALTTAEAQELFQRRRASWLAEDVAGYLDLFAPDLEIRVPGRPEPVQGRDRYEKLVRASLGWARPRSFEFHHLAVAGDVVLAEWTISVERRDTGAVLGWRGMSACQLAEGRIRWWREYWDPAAIA